VVWPASQIIFPPLVTTAGEKARTFCVALPSRYCTEDEDAGCCGAETTLPPVRSASPAPTMPTNPGAKRLNVGSPFLWNRLPCPLIRAMIAPGLGRPHSDKATSRDLVYPHSTRCQAGLSPYTAFTVLSAVSALEYRPWANVRVTPTGSPRSGLATERPRCHIAGEESHAFNLKA